MRGRKGRIDNGGGTETDVDEKQNEIYKGRNWCLCHSGRRRVWEEKEQRKRKTKQRGRRKGKGRGQMDTEDNKGRGKTDGAMEGAEVMVWVKCDWCW